MKKINLFTFGLALSLGSLFGQGQVTITDADLVGNTTYNWTKNNEYLLDGFVFVESGSTLNIEEGTVIKAKETISKAINYAKEIEKPIFLSPFLFISCYASELIKMLKLYLPH